MDYIFFCFCLLLHRVDPLCGGAECFKKKSEALHTKVLVSERFKREIGFFHFNYVAGFKNFLKFLKFFLFFLSTIFSNIKPSKRESKVHLTAIKPSKREQSASHCAAWTKSRRRSEIQKRLIISNSIRRNTFCNRPTVNFFLFSTN